ncbi:MAG: hypothetical protein WC426_13480 [Sulfuriferula sp.]
MNDEQNMQVLTQYQIYLVKQMDVLFSAIALLGLDDKNNKNKVIATMKQLEGNYKFNYSQFVVGLENILKPENAGDPAGAKAAAESEATNGKVKATTDKSAVPKGSKKATTPKKKK